MIARRQFMKVSPGAVNAIAIAHRILALALLQCNTEGPWLRV